VRSDVTILRPFGPWNLGSFGRSDIAWQLGELPFAKSGGRSV
jgi:hypothetical protein